MTDVIKIKQFNIQNIEASCSWLIVGPPGSGKTTFIKNLVYYNKHKYPVCKVVCSVPTTYTEYCKIFPELFVHFKFNKKDDENFVNKRQKPLSTSKDMSKYCLYILDDIDAEKKEFSTSYFAQLFKQGSRHWNMLTIMSNQYAIEFPPEIRAAATYVAIFRYPSQIEREKLYKNYGGDSIFKNKDTFNLILDQCTGNHCCLIIKQRSDSNNIEDCVFWYQTGILPEFKFGCREIWDYNNKKINKSKKYLIDS
jgi:predicted NACHT family NTPase